MIYILLGNDIKKKNTYLKKLYKSNLPIFIPRESLSKEMLLDYVSSVSLFGESPIIVLESMIKEGNIALGTEDLSALKDSLSIFVFMEEKLLAPDVKKYKKYGVVEEFSRPTTKQMPKMNVFDIAEAFSRKDKIGTWILYRDAISKGVQPEEVSGIIFWKIKMMLLNGTKIFPADELKKISSRLVSLYHKAHRGECDFVIGLEQFILSTLSK
jgi:hypothetical protein